MLDKIPIEFNNLPPIVKICAMGKVHSLLQRINEGEDFRCNNDWPAREAAFRGKHQILEVLLDKGVPTNTGNGALLKLACAEGYLNIVHILVKRKADISINDYEAYRWAIAKERQNIVDYLEPLVKQKKFFDKHLEEQKLK